MTDVFYVSGTENTVTTKQTLSLPFGSLYSGACYPVELSVMIKILCIYLKFTFKLNSSLVLLVTFTCSIASCMRLVEIDY